MKKTWFLTLWIICFGVACVFMVGAARQEQPVTFNQHYTLKEFARINGVKPGRLKEELGMRHLPGSTKLSGLPLSGQQAHELISHIRGGYDIKHMLPAQIAFAAAVFIAIALLWKKRMSPAAKCSLLALAVICAGLLLGKIYNPMVALVKTAKAFAGVEPGLYAWGAALLVFVLLAVIGNKAVCGWICPYGALQELLFKIPLAARLKQKIKIPFAVSNTIRCILFILFATGLATNLFNLKAQGRTLYHWVNPFNLFDLNLASASITAYIAATLLAAVFFYRPHCYFVCPFGLLSWALEKLSLFKIRIHPQKCTGCGACIKACPGRAMEGIYKGSALPADCFSCGECLHACQFDALSYSQQAPPAAQR